MVFKYAFKHPLFLILGGLTMALPSIFDSYLNPLLLSSGIRAIQEGSLDKFIFNLPPFGQLTTSFSVVVLIMIIGILLREVGIFISFYCFFMVEVNFLNDLRKDAFVKIQGLSFSYFDKTPSGWLISRLQGDTQTISEVFAWSFTMVFWAIFDIIMILFTMFSSNYSLTMIVLSVVPLLFISLPLLERALFLARRKLRASNSKYIAFIAEIINGAKTVKALGIEAKIDKEGIEVSKEIKKNRYNTIVWHLLFEPTILISSVLATILLLLIGEQLHLNNQVNIADIVLFITYSSALFQPIENISENIIEITAASASIEKMNSLLCVKQDIVDSEEVRRIYGDYLTPKIANYPPLKGDITYDHLTFSYDGVHNVLTDFSLHISQGENIAIVGETGGGKTTIVNLLARFYEPTKGRILIDNEDYLTKSLHYLRSNMAYIQQSPYIFSGTFYDNIRYGRDAATNEEIENISKLVGIDEMIKKFEKGYNTYLEEGGNILSTGEKQLIVFARAMIRDPHIIIFDEATSSIDTLTEAKIQKATALLTKGRTSIIIAHRLSTIVSSDRIIVIEQGKIIEEGTHTELMNKKGKYSELYLNQFKNLSIDEQFEVANIIDDK